MNETKKTAISAAIVLVAVILSAGWGYMGWTKCGEIQASMAQKTTQVVGLREKIAQIPSLRQEKSKLLEELSEFETILPNGPELDKIYDTLSDFTRDSGVTILEFRPEREGTDATAKTSSYKQVSYSLKLKGDFFQVNKFINLLENYKRFVRVDSFDMNKRGLEDPLADTALQISTFVYDPKGDAAAQAAMATGAPAPEPIPFVLAEERSKAYVVFAAETGSYLRDPFANPLTRKHPEGVDKTKIADNSRPLAPAQEKDMVGTTRQKLEAVSELIKEGDFEKAAEAFAEIEGNLTRKYRDTTLEPQLVEMRNQAKEISELLKSGRGKKLFELVKTQFDNMEQSFKVADYEKVGKMYVDARDLLKKAEGVDYEGLVDLVKETRALGERSKTWAEFASFDIEVQGVIQMEDGRSAAIINQQSLVEGDKVVLDGGGDLSGKGVKKAVVADADVFVHSIAQDKITFRYKGERIEKLLID